MAITPENLVRHELIGLRVRVSQCPNPKIEGVFGKVIDETKQMLVVLTEDGRKSFVKELSIFDFTLPSREKVRVNGKLLRGRPEDRIKSKLPKKWDVI